MISVVLPISRGSFPYNLYHINPSFTPQSLFTKMYVNFVISPQGPLDLSTNQCCLLCLSPLHPALPNSIKASNRDFVQRLRHMGAEDQREWA